MSADHCKTHRQYDPHCPHCRDRELRRRERELRASAGSASVSALTEDERYMCYGAYYAANSGELACMSHKDAARLEELGLIDLREPDEDFPDAAFCYTMTDLGETVAKEYRDAFYGEPNTSMRHAGPETRKDKP